MGILVKVRMFNAGPQAEADVSKPHILVEKVGDVHEVSSELAFRLIREHRAEEVVEDEPEATQAVEAPHPDEDGKESRHPLLSSLREAITPKAEAPPVTEPEAKPEPDDKASSALD